MYSLDEKVETLDSRVLKAVRACQRMLRGSDILSSEVEAVLYGSQARGDANPSSDVDLLVIVDDSVNTEHKKALHDSLYEISLKYDVVISSIIIARRQWESPVTKLLPLYKNIASEGIRVA